MAQQRKRSSTGSSSTVTRAKRGAGTRAKRGGQSRGKASNTNLSQSTQGGSLMPQFQTLTKKWHANQIKGLELASEVLAMLPARATGATRGRKRSSSSSPGQT